MAIFDDLITSSRGPGVIGTLIALVVLAGFGTLFMFAFDEGMGGGKKSIESVIRDQAVEVDSLKTTISESSKHLEIAPERKKTASEADEIARQTRLNKGKVDAASRIIEKVKLEIVGVQKSLEDYKQSYREQIRGEAVGLKYPELKTLTGKTFVNVSINKVDAVGISFRHADGSTRVAFDILPADIKEYFHYDVAEKDRAKAAENLIAGQHAQDVETALDQADRAKRTETIKLADAEKLQAKADQTAMIARIADLELQIKNVQLEWDNERMRVHARGSGVVNSATFQARISSLNNARSAANQKLQQATSVLQR
ncbi:MAG: hypothetical protein WCH40_05710 [Verrucomicrobiales bacterium]